MTTRQLNLNVHESPKHFDCVFNELLTIYADQSDENRAEARVTEVDMKRWAELTRTPIGQLCDAIGLRLAFNFHDERLSFAVCDAIVNDIFGMITSWNIPWPETFWQVYLAFDEGEYYHRDDMTKDPVAAYTKPQIGEIVRKQASVKT